ncbi:alpha-scruin-like [Uloborus diversus]|uniref:alpha-scruin-like n=1 Tax=Uloborus diversus TaxID=327109 RepID=UPI0024097D37|nr:alpha-scruin-like [Uloborus diversus]
MIFLPQENVWECAGFLAKPRCHHTAVFLANTLYIIGGFRNGSSLWIEDICAEVLSFNHANRRWKMKPSMNHDRAFHSSVIVDSKIFVIGGRNSFGDILSSVEVFIEEDNSWQECQSLPYPVLSAAVTVIGNFIYIFGGITIGENSEIISTHTLVFDPKLNSWFFGAELQIPCACSGAANFLNHAFLLGGLIEERDNLQSIQEILQLDIFSQTWSELGKLSVPRHSPVTVQIGSNIYVIGGFSTQEDKAVAICEVLNISDGTVTPIAPLPHPISGMAGIILPSTITISEKVL